MVRLMWDKQGSRYYEVGVDRGVLYVGAKPGVVWNGLISVNTNPSGAEASPQYADNIKYLNLISVEEFGATIEAFAYPEEFEVCLGIASVIPGLNVYQQRRKSFGLVFRTLVGNDLDGLDHAYKLHLVYDATVSPSESAYSTMSESPEATTFNWEISTIPSPAAGSLRPTAHVIIDSRTAPVSVMESVEDILYGSDNSAPRLPRLLELLDLLVYPGVDAGQVTTITSSVTDGGTPSSVYSSTIDGGNA